MLRVGSNANSCRCCSRAVSLASFISSTRSSVTADFPSPTCSFRYAVSPLALYFFYKRIQIFFGYLIGAFYGLLFLRSNSIFESSVLHVCNNFFASWIPASTSFDVRNVAHLFDCKSLSPHALHYLSSDAFSVSVFSVQHLPCTCCSYF
jgi:hypothetical protein